MQLHGSFYGFASRFRLMRCSNGRAHRAAPVREYSILAFKEFPGGAKRVAELALRPGMTFYEVEYLEPGKNTGMKYHLLYWDGKQWSMLGPAWRVLKQ